MLGLNRTRATRALIVAAAPVVLGAGLLVTAPTASAAVNTGAPYGAWNWGDCHVMVGGFLNPSRWGYGDTTVQCRTNHSMSITTRLYHNGSWIRTGSRSAYTWYSGDVLTTPGVCGARSGSWQTVGVVSIAGYGTYTFTGPLGGAYPQGGCP